MVTGISILQPFKKEAKDIAFGGLKEIIDRLSPKPITTLGDRDEFFRSLFIDVAQNENLNNLKDCFESKFNINSPKYCPHISLFYGIEDDATKKEIIRKLKVPKSATMDKISIVKVDEEIKSWEILKSYSLFKLKQ